MEKRISLAKPVATGAGLGDGAVVVEVADVEELVVVEAVLAAERDVGFYVVELAEFGGEGDVAGVVEGGAAEDEDAVLGRSVRKAEGGI